MWPHITAAILGSPRYYKAKFASAGMGVNLDGWARESNSVQTFDRAPGWRSKIKQQWISLCSTRRGLAHSDTGGTVSRTVHLELSTGIVNFHTAGTKSKIALN